MGQYSFATNLKKERTNKGITQHELATGVHVAQNTVAKIRGDLFDHMQNLPLKYFDTQTHGELMSR